MSDADLQKTYFAALSDPEDFAKQVFARKLKYEQFLRDTGMMRLYSKMNWMYFGKENGKPYSTMEVGKAGAEGELHVLKVNHLRSIITGWDSTLGSQRTALEPVPQDGDYESLLQKKRAKALLNHYVSSASSARLEYIETMVREYACVFGAGWGLQLWNHLIGPPAIPSVPQMGEDPSVAGLATGDLQSWALWGLNVAFDPYRKDSKIPWYLCRLWFPKHAAVKRWPEFEEELLKSVTPRGQQEQMTEPFDFGLFTAGIAPTSTKNSDDEIPLYFFCHDPNECLPNGKQAFLLNGQTTLEWDDLLYRGRDGARRMPLTRLAPAEVPESPIGWTPAFGMMAAQEAVDSYSTIELTNGRTFGLGTLTAEKGADIDEEQVSMGLLLVEYNKGTNPPQVLQMPQTPEQMPMSRQKWIAEMGMMVGTSGAARGDPSAMVDKSGSALAFIDAKGLQYNSKFAGSNVMWREDFYLTTVLIAQNFMTIERQFEVMGQEVSVLMPPFSGQHLDRITHIKVQAVNPLSQTIAGKIQLAETLATRWSANITPGQWMRIIEEGNADFMTRDEAQADRNMDRENELLSMGVGEVPRVPMIVPVPGVVDPQTGMPAMQPMMEPTGVVDPMTGQPKMRPKMIEQPAPGMRYVRALLADHHAAHIKRHLAVLNNPAVREGSTPEAQAVLKAALEHIDRHARLWADLTLQRPDLLQATGQQPLASALPPLPPGVEVGGAAHDQRQGAPAGQPPTSGALPGANNKGSPEMKAEQPTSARGQEMPRMPSLPTNPSTGRKPPGPVAHPTPAGAVQ